MLKLYRDSFSGLSRSIWLLALVLLINRAGTMVIPFMTVYLTTILGFSFSQAGVVMMFFGFGSVLGSLWGGWLTDRIGYYHIMFWTLFLSGLMFIVLAHVTAFVPLCITIFILSLIADAYRPANYAATAAYSKPENLTRSFSLLRIAVNLGFSVGPAIGGYLAASVGFKALFWADGLTCVTASLLLLVFLPYRKQPKKEIKAEEALQPIRSAYRDTPYLIFVGMIMLSAMAFLQLFTAVPVFLKKELLLSEGQIGALLALNGFLIAITEMPVVFKFDGRFKRINLVILGTLLIGLSFCAFLLPLPAVLLGILSILLITAGEIFNMPFANTIAMDRATDRNRGQYMALYAMAFSIAHIVAPFMGMYIAENHGWPILWLVLFSLCFFALLGFWSLDRYVVRQRAIA